MNDLRLNAHLLHISGWHPWYKELLRENGIEHPNPAPLDNFTLLKKLPLLTAELLEKHYYSQPPRTEEGLSVYRTSGTSSGIRKAIYYSNEDDEQYTDAKRTSFNEWLGDDHGVIRALADLGTGHAASTAIAIFASLGIEGESIPFTAPIEEHLAKLKQYRPHLLYTMPSILEAIADAAESPQELGLRKIILVGELASSEWQARMAERFGLAPADLLDTLGSIEVGAIAAYSHELGSYVLSEGLLGEALPAERIDSSFAPLRSDEGVLTLTSFHRTLFPVMRFVTYDVVRNFRTVLHQGKQIQLFDCLTKRIGRELKHGEKISLYDIEEVVSRHLDDATLRVKVEHNKLKLYIKSGSMGPAAAEAIKRDVEHKIEDIGMMIRNRLLQGIEVVHASGREELPSGSVKAKKLYQ
ncbi:hypothetical protein ACFQZE_16495 [Paenibacillus sp. GCM10027627]|uniref:hypothetical protein n=1 Tax=unclassified Paenibacillus TaxID=185978 RepID=UPI003636F984